MLSEPAEDLQPLSLVTQLGPGPEPGLAGVLHFLVSEGERLAEPALMTQQGDQITDDT